MSALKKLVLKSFKMLHRTRLRVFKDDIRALTAAKEKINNEYKKNKHVSHDEAIKEMIQFAADVDKELRTQVIQAREVKPGVFEARITEDTLKIENKPFNESGLVAGEPRAPAGCCRQPAPPAPASPARTK